MQERALDSSPNSSYKLTHRSRSRRRPSSLLLFSAGWLSRWPGSQAGLINSLRLRQSAGSPDDDGRVRARARVAGQVGSYFYIANANDASKPERGPNPKEALG